MRQLILIFLIAFSVGSTFADEEVGFGEIVSIRMNANTSDLRAEFRGLIVLRVSNSDRTFYFGGSRCPGRDLTDFELAALQEASLAPYMRVKFYYKFGQGGSDCIVGHEISNSKFVTN